MDTIYLVLCVLATFVAGMEVGFRWGYREGQRRGYELDPFYRYIRDAVDHIMREP